MVTRGIPTEYAGVRFRSRLEARWASFFDLLRWRWAYEPFDLRGYIPDFVIAHRSRDVGHNVLIEVEPETTLDGLWQHVGKIESSGWADDAIIVGVSPMLDATGDLCLGHGMPYLDDPPRFVNEAPNGVPFGTCARCRAITASAWGAYNTCIVCGESVLSRGDYEIAPLDAGLVRSLWVTAKNRVQWKGEFGG